MLQNNNSVNKPPKTSQRVKVYLSKLWCTIKIHLTYIFFIIWVVREALISTTVFFDIMIIVFSTFYLKFQLQYWKKEQSNNFTAVRFSTALCFLDRRVLELMVSSSRWQEPEVVFLHFILNFYASVLPSSHTHCNDVKPISQFQGLQVEDGVGSKCWNI